jgi:hypothetical protein
MKKLLLIIFSLISLGLIGQDFASPGSIWHYTSIDGMPATYSYTSIKHIGDTLIQGNQCNILQQYVYTYTDTIEASRIHCFERNDSVLVYDELNQDFFLLYDFNANAGDTIRLEQFSIPLGNPMLVVVDSVSWIQHNNTTRKVQHVSSWSVMWDFGREIIEGIGSTFYMFPSADFVFYGPLRCYDDSLNGLWFNPFYQGPGWNMTDCDDITGVEENIFPADHVKIYPNPAIDFINFEGLFQTTEVEIADINGSLLLKTRLNPESNRINISTLSNGVYILKYTEGTKPKYLRFLKI